MAVCSRSSRDFGSRGHFWGSALGALGWSPREAREFSKICKNIWLENCENYYFSIFVKNLKNKELIMRALDEKHKCFEKILQFFDVNAIETFFKLCWKIIAKYRIFGDNIIFLQQFPHFEGISARSQCLRHWIIFAFISCTFKFQLDEILCQFISN